MGAKIKIRDLTVADRDWLSDLIKKLVVKLGASEILKYMVSDDTTSPEEKGETGKPKERYVLLAIEIFKLLLEVMSGDVREWFASLAQVEPDKFKDLPYDAELQIIEQLVALGEADHFFERLLALSNKMKGSVGGLVTKSAG
jgi:hypothetical protein